MKIFNELKINTDHKETECNCDNQVLGLNGNCANCGDKIIFRVPPNLLKL